MTSRKIAVGMSGGVDSSMSLLLLKQQGWQPIGVSLKLPVWENEKNLLRENVCCTDESLRIAQGVCRKLNVPHHIYDVQEDFRKEVISYFISELRQRRTPNPCAVCNRSLKFTKLFEFAQKHGIDYIATGHYAKTRLNAKTGKTELLRPKDKEKDQTYGMCLLPRELLGHIIFPLGDLTKKEVYATAKRNGFEIFLKRKQSQDLCFVAGKALPLYLEEEIGRNPGRIIDSGGKILGRHKGLHFYTIGQRHGLGLAGTYFVKAFDLPNNKLVVTANREELGQQEALLSSPNFLSGEPPKKELSVVAQVRNHQAPTQATLFPAGRSARILFKKPVDSITPGQVCAFYKKDVCLGGAFISGVC